MSPNAARDDASPRRAPPNVEVVSGPVAARAMASRFPNPFPTSGALR